MRAAVILGTRPEMIKMSPVVRELERKNIARAVKLESALASWKKVSSTCASNSIYRKWIDFPKTFIKTPIIFIR